MIEKCKNYLKCFTGSLYKSWEYLHMKNISACETGGTYKYAYDSLIFLLIFFLNNSCVKTKTQKLILKFE